MSSEAIDQASERAAVTFARGDPFGKIVDFKPTSAALEVKVEVSNISGGQIVVEQTGFRNDKVNFSVTGLVSATGWTVFYRAVSTPYHYCRVTLRSNTGKLLDERVLSF